MTRTALRTELSKLSRAQRIQLVQELWDTIADEPDDMQLTSDEKKLLDERVVADRKNPSAAQPWTTVKRHVMAKVKSSRRRV